MLGGFLINLAFFIGAMVDPFFIPVCLQCFILISSKSFPPLHQYGFAVPIFWLFGFESVASHVPCGHHNMSMAVALIALLIGLVDIDPSDHASFDVVVIDEAV